MSVNKEVNFKVSGMHCGSCVGRIKQGLASLNIELETKFDVSEGLVIIKFNKEETSVSDLKSAIIHSGFQVESLSIE